MTSAAAQNGAAKKCSGNEVGSGNYSAGDQVRYGDVIEAGLSQDGLSRLPPDRQRRESVHGVVRLRSGASASGEELMLHCRELLAGYRCPRSIEFRTDPLPTTAAGKILKRDLRTAYWEGASRAVIR